MEAVYQRLEAVLPKLEALLGSEEPSPDDGGMSGVNDMPGMDHNLGQSDEYDDLLNPQEQEEPAELEPQEPPKKMDACGGMGGMSSAGAMNSYIPSDKKDTTRMSAATQISPEKLDAAVKDQVERQTTAKFSRLEQENAALKAKIDTLEAQNKVTAEERELAIVQNLLGTLDAQGYKYKPEVEIPSMVKMSKEERDARVLYIQQFHQRELVVPGRGRIAVPTEAQATVKFSKATQAETVDPTAFSSAEEAVACAIQASAEGKKPKDVLLQKRQLGHAASNGIPTSVR
jgi:hypothetical protein